MFSCESINIELIYDKTCVTASTKYNAIDKPAQTRNTIFPTAHNYDSVYFAIIFNIDIYTSKQTKRAITNTSKSNGEISNVIDAVVMDMYKRTQTEKNCFYQIQQPILH